MCKKVIVFGIDNEYNARSNSLRSEVLKGNIEILGFGGSGKRYLNTLDNYKVYEQAELFRMNFDYVIVFSGAYQIIVNNLVKMKIDRSKIINGNIFDLPCFDFILYTNLIENPITIFSDDCWGGMLCHYLNLPLNSPTVNLRISKLDFFKFVLDYEYYINNEIQCVQEANIYRCKIVRGSIGDDDKKIFLEFNHHVRFADAAEDWNRRKSRINKDNIFIKMSVDDANLNILKQFEALPFKNKVAFAPEKLPQFSSAVILPRYIERCMKEAIKAGTNNFSAYVRNTPEVAKSIDILKMLNGLQDFRRDS